MKKSKFEEGYTEGVSHGTELGKAIILVRLTEEIESMIDNLKDRAAIDSLKTLAKNMKKFMDDNKQELKKMVGS